MTPYAAASAFYLSHPNEGQFLTVLEFHFREGCVISTPTLFMMGRPVCLYRNYTDTWFVEFAAGSMRDAVCAMPFWLPFIAFARKGRLKSMQPPRW